MVLAIGTAAYDLFGRRMAALGGQAGAAPGPQ
jgi:hypothetical protein